MGVLGCCQAKVQPDDGTVGIAPPTKRKCRDLICVIIFLAFWLIMFVIAAVGAKNGDPYRLLYGVDHQGLTCGAKTHSKSKNIFYPRLNQDLYAAVTAASPEPINPLTLNPYGICVNTCPKRGDFICNAEGEATLATVSPAFQTPAARGAYIRLKGMVDSNTERAAGPCWFVTDDQKPTFFRCLPADTPAGTSSRECYNDAAGAVYPRCTEDKFAEQTAVCTGTAGSFTLTHAGVESAAIPFGANAATVQAAFQGMSSVNNASTVTFAAGKTAACDGTGSNTMTLTFSGIPGPQVLLTSTGTGGPSLVHASTVTGVKDANTATVCTPAAPHYVRAKGKTGIVGEKDVVPSKACVSTRTTTSSEIIGANTHPDDEQMQNPLVAQLKSTMAKVGRWAGDIAETWGAILMLGGVLSMVLGVVWLVLFKYCAGFMVWFVVWASFFGMVALALYASSKGGMLDGVDNAMLNTAMSSTGLSASADRDAEREQENSWKVLAYIAVVLSFILLVMILFLRKKIKVSIGIIREASNCIKRQPLMIAFPIIPFIMTLVLFGYFCLVGGLIQSSGDIELSDVSTATGQDLPVKATTNTTGFEKGKLNDYMMMYHLFGVLWANALINAIGLCTLAGATCRYYWSRNKNKEEMGKTPIASSFKNCFRYHFGSLVFGALIIAIVQFIRVCLEYIDRQTKSLQDKSGPIKVAMKVVKCCMWCLEKIVKFISRNAYIMIAMKGKSFCASTVEAFKLIWKLA